MSRQVMAELRIPLDIANVWIHATKIMRDKQLYIRLESELERVTCGLCGQTIKCNYGLGKEIKLRHLDVLGMKTIIGIRPKRGQCPTCPDGPTTTQVLEWYQPRAPHTKAYDHYLLKQLVGSTIEDVSLKEEVGYDALLGVLKRHVATSVDWSQLNDLKTIGIDEIAMKKGHKDYAAIITARQADGQLKILGVLADRKKKSVRAFLDSIPNRLRLTIEHFTTDMWEGYLTAIADYIAAHDDLNAYYVIDRFHVAQQYRKRFDVLRKQEMKRLKQSLSEATYEADCQGTLWLWRKNHDKLDEAERKRLRRLLVHSPQLHAAYTLREELTALFNNRDLSWAMGMERLTKWVQKVEQSQTRCFDKFIKTLTNHWQGIVNYFHERINSGFVEGLNNKIKVIKRRCYGLKKVTTLFQRLWLDLEGLTAFAP